MVDHRSPGTPSDPLSTVDLSEALRFWLKLGFINFGGPTGQIAIMHDELVERRRWIGEDRFLHALSYCMLLPGPEAQQLAIYVGWLLNGTTGGIAAGVLFVLPAFFVLLGLSYAYAAHGDLGWVTAIFDGLSAAVVGIVVAATIQVGRRALKTRFAWVIASAAFAAIFVLGVPFPFVVLGAGAAGVFVYLVRPDILGQQGDAATSSSARPADEAAAASHLRASPGRAFRVLVVGLLVWWGPILAIVLIVGTDAVYAREGLFFSQVAVITFGGAYAVLAYVGQEVVARFGLATTDVVAGLGLAETTPGPLIMVVQFLGFLAAYRSPGSLAPVVAGTIGAAVTVWATFVPSFLWIFLGAPYIERLRSEPRLRAALSTITASVVGVISSLAVTFGAAVLFEDVGIASPVGHAIPSPVWASIDGFALAVAAAAFAAMWRFRVAVPWIVLASAGAGLLWSALR